MKIYHIAQSKIEVPPEMGVLPVPDNNIRLFHFTRGNIEDIRKNGLLISQAQGSKYGEPDMIWGSTSLNEYKEMASYKNIIEFSVPVQDIGFPKQYGQEDIDKLNSGSHHVGIFRDIRPNEILAIHEPWHSHYRYMEKDKELLKEVINGEHDELMDGRFPSEGKAVQAIKNNYK